MNNTIIKSNADTTKYLEETPLLNYSEKSIQTLIKERNWLS